MTHDDPMSRAVRARAEQDRVIAACFDALRGADADLLLEIREPSSAKSAPLPPMTAVPAFAVRG